MVADNEGKIFDDRRKRQRRVENIKVEVEKRKGPRRKNDKNKKK